MDFEGVIIEESLEDKSVLSKIKIESTKVETVTEKHKTPWIKQWTLHTVLVEADKAGGIAGEISKALDYSQGTSWYADFKNDNVHYIIFKDKVFKIERDSKDQYQEATDYGISLGIPEYQVDFSPNIVVWKRN